MTVNVIQASTLFQDAAFSLYNRTSASALPAASGVSYGIDGIVHGTLIDLTEAGSGPLHFQFTRDNGLKGMCLWASVVATKFFVHRNFYRDVRVVGVGPGQGSTGGNHFFVVARLGKTPVICDITCKQFGGPDFIVGTLQEVRSSAKKVSMRYGNLYDAYKAGAQTDLFVM